MSPQLSVAIVVVSYNSADYLGVCLESLLEDLVTYPLETFALRILIVENGADEASKAMVAKVVEQINANSSNTVANKFISLAWQRAPSNLGYAGGANWGWQILGAADFYMVLNPDMRFVQGWLANMLAPFRNDSSVGVVGCKLLDGQGLIQHAGGLVMHGAALGLHFGVGQRDDGRWDVPAEVEFVTGAALAIRQAVLQKTGGFDARFWPGYYEDVDLCARVRQAGFKIWYEPTAVAFHYEGATFGRSSGYFRAFHRNRLRYVLKNLTAHRLLADFVPAERARLRGMLALPDRRASEAIYRATWLSLQPALTKRVKQANIDGETEVSDILGHYDAGLEKENVQVAQLENQLDTVKASWKVEEKPFRSGLPLVATMREKFNSISTKWYVRPILQQQVDYNGAVARVLETLGQLVAGRDVAHDMEYTALASRLTTLEERLDRIETLLERLLDTYPANRVSDDRKP